MWHMQIKGLLTMISRVRTLRADLPPKIAEESRERCAAIAELLGTVTVDLHGIDSWRYQRQISPGIQEYVEAVSFEHYLKTQALITMAEAQDKMPRGVELTYEDYVLGLFDLVGELMRFAITTMATTASQPGSTSEDRSDRRTILMDMQLLRGRFEALDMKSGDGGFSRNGEKKMEVMSTCVDKVESAVYGLTVRGSERPKGWFPEPDMTLVGGG
jgi:hypothetical protein